MTASIVVELSELPSAGRDDALRDVLAVLARHYPGRAVRLVARGEGHVDVVTGGSRGEPDPAFGALLSTLEARWPERERRT